MVDIVCMDLITAFDKVLKIKTHRIQGNLAYWNSHWLGDGMLRVKMGGCFSN